MKNDMMRLTKIRMGRTGISSVMATIIIVVVTLAIVITASLWSGGLSSIFTRYENVEVKNTHITSRDGEHTVIVQYENVGSTETRVEDILINDVPYSDYTPTPKLDGALGSLPSACEIGVPKVGTISFKDGATDRNGNRLTSGVTLIITISTRHGHKFQATMVIPDGGSQSSITQESSGTNSTLNSSSSVQTTTQASNGTRFRLGATVPLSSVRGFGDKHGISIELDYRGGQIFYNYMTKGPGYFAHIDLATGVYDVWGWGGNEEFIRGVLGAADADCGRCEISLTLYQIDLGWTGLWEPYLLEILEKIGPNRPSMRYIFLAGEWSYSNRQPPTYDELEPDFLKAKNMVASYGYELGWTGEGKYLTIIPKEYWAEIESWGKNMQNKQLTRHSDPITGGAEAYGQGKSPPSCPTNVFLNCLTMWDTPANVPGEEPYYIYYEKFDGFLKGATERYDAENSSFPQSVVFDVMPETFNDVEGVNCPYLDWWMEIAHKYNIRTSQTPPVPVPRPPPMPTPPSPFPPYPTEVAWSTAGQNLPPFMVQAGTTFKGFVYAKRMYDWEALGNREIEIYLVNLPLRPDSYYRQAHAITKDDWAAMLSHGPYGSIITKQDGWSTEGTFQAPSLPGYYTIVARIPPSATEMEGFARPIEFLIVVDKVHRVEVRSNVKMRLTFGPTSEGPPWQGVDSQRWCGPDGPIIGNCGEMNWSFVAQANVTGLDGKEMIFKHWKVEGSETYYVSTPKLDVMVDSELLLTAEYEPQL